MVIPQSSTSIFLPPEYTVGVVCALPKELFALRALFDYRYQDPQVALDPYDTNSYVFGRIGHHDIVAACLPQGEYGTNSAADVASNMNRTFPALRFCLLVGIGGGVPSKDHDIRLGDVVVSQPTERESGVIQYDLGKTMEDGTFKTIGSLIRPPRVLMKAISNLASDPELPPNSLRSYLEQIAARNPSYRHPGQWQDILYESSPLQGNPCNGRDHCDCPQIQREDRSLDHPRIFYGIIASGNQVVKSSKMRDRLGEKHKILCLEMEAAGVMNTFPFLVIRGICDYADSHKNNTWQEYAAATAAAYAKLLLSYVRPLRSAERSAPGLLNGSAQGTLDSGQPSYVSVPASTTERPMKESLNSTIVTGFKPSTTPESRLAERRTLARRRQVWNPWPNDALRIFRSLERWMSVPGSSLLVLEASPPARARAEDLAFEVVDFLLSTTPYTVIYSLSSLSCRSESTYDLLDSVIFQSLRINTTQPPLEYQSIHGEKDSEVKTWGRFQAAVSQLHHGFLIIEGRDARCTERILTILSETINHPEALIKSMVIAYTTYLSFKDIPPQRTYETVKIPSQPPQGRRKMGLTTGRATKWKHLKPRFASVEPTESHSK